MENKVVYLLRYFQRKVISNKDEVKDEFPDEGLVAKAQANESPWFADVVNYKVV